MKITKCLPFLKLQPKSSSDGKAMAIGTPECSSIMNAHREYHETHHPLRQHPTAKHVDEKTSKKNEIS